MSRIGVLFALSFVTSAAFAETFPTKPVTLIVPYATGGNSDIMGRAVGQKLSELWKQPVVIENRPGGTTTVGLAHGARQPADGYTMTLVAPPGVITQHVYKNLPYKTLTSFQAASLVAIYPVVVVVHPALPINNLKELFDYARAKPGTAYPSPGAGTTGHLVMERVSKDLKLDFTHVPYKSGGQGVTDLIGGRLQFYPGPALEVLPHIRSGRLRAIGVFSDERMKILPDAPTGIEQGYKDYVISSWTTIAVPTGTPKAIVEKISTSIAQATKDPSLKDKLEDQGAVFIGSTPDAAQAFWEKEDTTWGPLAKSLNLQAD